MDNKPIQSSSDLYGASITITGPVVYVGDDATLSNVTTTNITPLQLYDHGRIKRTRKKAYTHFLTYWDNNYPNLPRKVKKSRKKGARSWCYYKGKITLFHPFLLSTPASKGMRALFRYVKTLQVNSGKTMKFSRYEQAPA